MLGNTEDGALSRRDVQRETRLEHVAQAAVVLGVLAIAVASVPSVRFAAWIPAIPALVLAAGALALGIRRRLSAGFALVLGWFALSYSVALALWG